MNTNAVTPELLKQMGFVRNHAKTKYVLFSNTERPFVYDTKSNFTLPEFIVSMGAYYYDEGFTDGRNNVIQTIQNSLNINYSPACG